MIINIKLKHPLCGVDFLQHAYKQPQQVSHLSLTFCCHKKFFYPTQKSSFFYIAKWQKAAACAGRLRTSILVRFRAVFLLQYILIVFCELIKGRRGTANDGALSLH